jgi:DNA-binding MarR family transcriptional regulator
MSETIAKDGTKERRRKVQDEDFTMASFAELISYASRLLTNLSALEPFKQAKMGLAEWTMMTIVAQNENITSAQVARQLGITAQRVNQLAESLKASQLISLQPLAEDSRKKVVQITDAGRNELAALNSRLEPILIEPMKTNAKTVPRTVRGLRRVVKLTKVGPDGKPRAARAERRRGERPAG